MSLIYNAGGVQADVGQSTQSYRCDCCQQEQQGLESNDAAANGIAAYVTAGIYIHRKS
jgi:hypothetical protein